MDLSLLSNQTSKITTQPQNHTCSHTQVTRLFDLYGSEKCSICHKRPSLGWLYRCTQDLGHLPASDFYNVEDTLTKPEHDARLYTLSPSISEAIVDGHYTDAEVLRLVQQKECVRRIILESTLSTSSNSMSTISSCTTFPESQTSSSISSSTNDLMYEIGFDPIVKRPLTPIYEGQNGQEECVFVMPCDAMSTKSTKTSMSCNFKVCQTCRPVYRDRSWTSLNTILSSSCSLPPQYEFDNRRVSDVKVVRVMNGLQWDARRYVIQQYINSDKVKKSSRAEFQDTVRYMLRDCHFFSPREDDEVQTSSTEQIEVKNNAAATIPASEQ